ncbi:DUF916 and DUF3324 domain-containing protein [Enterococcus sp. S23]|uniref:DUF916 and DUF3324 domain-containing protein n=2 Tax=unclassified Enterococcus TaxID=2608891 RepID=UPI001CE20361|nr:DUF916 and DUF3324 domain-containing protein [Enterococcus sp. S23]MCA5013521.1 DUF916 and DUF3324 domain-containing protein [Enterococcus sp. S23]MCA5016771.1 DUF916 and DUF3324 domain-containing protein [Enterococcus sp. S22(2020)]
MRKDIRFLLFLFIGSISCQLISMKSAEAKDSESSAAFYYEVIHPENQLNDVGYFDLRMKPEQKQTVKINLINTGDQPLTIEVSLNSAKSSSNGVIDYGPNRLPKDQSLDLDFTELVKTADLVDIPARSSKELLLEITMPKEQFDGTIAGGIQLQVKEEKSKQTQEQAINNRFAYLIGMLLTETDVAVEPDLIFRNVYAGQNNFRNTIFVEFSNIAKTFMEEMQVDVQIQKVGEKSILFSEVRDGMRMAPNSLLRFPISLSGERMRSGEYNAKIKISDQQNEWHWNETFFISKEEAQKYNKEDVDIAEKSVIDWKLLIILLLLVVIFLGFLGIILYSKHQKKDAKN